MSVWWINVRAESIAKLKQLREDVSDPVKLKTMLRDILVASGFEEAVISQVGVSNQGYTEPGLIICWSRVFVTY